MHKHFIIHSIVQLPALAAEVLQCGGNNRIYIFEGEMGSGKTTLIKEICRQLGSSDNFSSPSYAIANEYQSDQGKIFHLDLYRIKNVEEAIDAGIEEYLHSGAYCFIEWPDVVESLLPGDVVRVSIHHDGEVRNVSIFTATNTIL